MTTEFFPEQTIRYKTGAKRTLVEALTGVFRNHPDELLQRTKVSIEYPRTEADYPSVIIRFFERTIFNAGVGHQETNFVNGESDSIEIAVTLPTGGSVQFTWPAIAHATGYKIYKGTVSDQENQVFTSVSPNFTDSGQRGSSATVPDVVTAAIDTPQPTAVIAPPGQLAPGTYYYRVVALAPSQAVRFQHYFYTADVEFAVYALSAYDRDLIADSLVQTIAMGRLETYTNQFFDRVYPDDALYPDSDLHFIALNSDQIQGFGESQSQTPWGAEDDLLYTTSYRVGMFGELYSLPPKLTYAIVQKLFIEPYIEGVEGQPPGLADDTAPWVSNE